MRVGDYEIGDVIGDRGTGTVYSARHLPSDRQVAIKVLHSRRQDVVDQLVQGANAVSRVHHANLVDITEVGATHDGTFFLAMELLSGESLHDRLQRVGPLPLFDTINIVRQISHGLSAAHGAGIVHGGLEPTKIFLCRRDGRRRVVRRNPSTGMKLVVEPEGKFDLVKLLDLGLKRFLDLASYQSDPREAARYWSPEQAQRRATDLRSDIYALGAVFYEMVTGTVPFDGASLAEVLRHHVSGVVTAPSQRMPGVADSLVDEVILRCLHKTPGERFSSTDELCDALDACVTDCAFLRDAHHWPGIAELGIDLPEARSKPQHQPPAPTEAGAVFSSVVARAPTPPTTEGAGKPVPIAATREPERGKQRASAAVEKAPVRAAPAVPSRGAPPPVPRATARKPPPPRIATPPIPVAAAALPPPVKTAAPAPRVHAVEPSSTKPETPPPAPLSSDLLTEIGDEPDRAAPAATSTDAPAEVMLGEARRHGEAERPREFSEAPALHDEATAAPEAPQPPGRETPSPLDQAPAAGFQAARLVEPEASTAAPPWPAAEREAPAPAELERQPPTITAPAAPPEAGDEATVAPEPTSDTPKETESRKEVPDPTATLARKVTEQGDRADEEDDADEELLPGMRESGRRSKVIAIAAVAIIAGLALWASRGRSKSPAHAPVPRYVPSATPTLPSPPAPTPPPSQSATPPQVGETPSRPSQRLAPAALAPVQIHAPLSNEPSAAFVAMVREPKPGPSKARPTSVATKDAAPAARAVTTAPESPPPPKARAASAANVPPRLAGAAPKPASRTTERPGTSEADSAPNSTPTSAEQLVREAQQAWLGGLHALALSRAQAALAASPKPAQAVQAYEIVATCSCLLHRRDRALEAASHLDSSRRESVKAVCAKNAVPFE